MLKTVEIKNFRSCYETNFEFGRTLCAISGRNGVGKSNILKAIEWACSTVVVADAVRSAPAGNASEFVDARSVAFGLDLDGRSYHYRFEVPPYNRRFDSTQLPLVGLSESFSIGEGEAETSIFNRSGESIELAGRPEQIRIPRTTPAVAALHSLLPTEDALRIHIDRLTDFFGGIRYYSLDDRPDARDYVTEQSYNEWKFRYQTEGDLTSSVAIRLIYMWQEKKELFEELLTILGPDGLNVISHIDVMPMDRHVPGMQPPKDIASGNTKLFMPLFQPSEHMGGAGGLFPFSSLSVGTRRVVRVVASMLFDRRSLMLMEQPEDSIHPGLLRKLIDQLRSYSFETQMLFTTHSLEVLDILRPEEILLATAPAGSTKVRALTSDEIDRAKEFLKSEGTLSDFLEPLDDL